jgi:hypothetical protein
LAAPPLVRSGPYYPFYQSNLKLSFILHWK